MIRFSRSLSHEILACAFPVFVWVLHIQLVSSFSRTCKAPHYVIVLVPVMRPNGSEHSPHYIIVRYACPCLLAHHCFRAFITSWKNQIKWTHLKKIHNLYLELRDRFTAHVFHLLCVCVCMYDPFRRRYNFARWFFKSFTFWKGRKPVKLNIANMEFSSREFVSWYAKLRH